MPKAEKVLEVVTDVPWSVPSEVGVVVDLPPKTFSVNPKIAIPVALGVLVVGGFAAVKVWKKRKDDKAAAVEVELEFDEDLDKAANDELDKMNAASKPKQKKSATDTPTV